MRSLIVTVAITAVLSLSTTCAFIIPYGSPMIGRPVKAGASDYNYDNFEDAYSRNVARTCVRNFLTQRAVQSFTFLLETCRDPHTVRWLEQNFGFQNLNNWHGTGAFNLTKYPTWDIMLVEMLALPKDVVVVSAKRRGPGHGGWSKKNPFLPDRFVEFTIDIDPPSLVSRILSVREQVAREFHKDLDTVMKANENIMSSYALKQVDARQKSKKDDAESRNTDERHLDEPGRKESSTGDDNKTPKYKESLVFDRDAMTTFTNSIAMSDSNSSPFRAGNFDLLVLLATQESIHRVLRSYQQDLEREVSFHWFRGYYSSKTVTYFDGDQSYGRADDFLEELLLTSPMFIEVADVKKMGLVDPLRIAEDVIQTRAEVIKDWREILVNIPQEHTALRMAALDRQMGRVTLEPTYPSNNGGSFE